MTAYLLNFRSEALQLETTVNCTILKTYEIIKDTTKDAFNLCKKKKHPVWPMVRSVQW